MSLRRILADQAFSRIGGAPLVAGNRVRLLKDAAENYPAWRQAIAAAERTVHFESYIIHDDPVGREFAELLAAKAGAGVTVRLLYDWFGGLGHAGRRFWRRLRRAGVDVRCFNPPRFDSPFGWLSRDHRKTIVVDHRLAFVTGLCVGQRWVGDAAHGNDPWRDTGIELEGPAVADIEQAFAQTWALTGAAVPTEDLPDREDAPVSGRVPVRVIASIPTTAALYRLDQLVAASARKTLWLTDAYFVGVTPYVEALRGAAADGVDVRLLVPGANDVWLIRGISRASYRPLLEAGIRVFEWNGSMMHAKTAVADGRWARVGSTNLNLASWIGNWELDVVVEDDGFARAMDAMFLEDLHSATEVVQGSPRRAARGRPRPRRGARGSAGRMAAGAIGIGSAIGAAVTDHRLLGAPEARVLGAAGAGLLLVAALAALWPWLLAVPLAALSAWVAAALLIRAWRLWR
ncbi:MAG: cardiolipin synthase B [Candidatus Rokubacteria bacterium]|nr:cardiolipin synthase B [Candidatus Rokubacteria bacterium]